MPPVLDSKPAGRGFQTKVCQLRHQLATELNKLSNAMCWDGELEAAIADRRGGLTAPRRGGLVITTFKLSVANWRWLGLSKDG
jgi:hypothetical protein